MKNIIRLLVMTLMLFVFSGCDEPTVKPQPEKPKQETVETQKPEEVKEDEGKAVSIAEFMKTMRYQDGGWDCPGQYNSDRISFRYEDEHPLAVMERFGEKHAELSGEIVSVFYQADKKVYTVHLIEYDVPLKYDVLHIEADRLAEGYINAEDVFADNQMTEYIFLEHQAQVAVNTDLVYKYETLELDPRFYPTLTLRDDGTFEFYENCYSKMGYIRGTWYSNGQNITCQITETELQGFAGGDLSEIIFNEIEDTLRLDTDICYSRLGMVFRQPD
ncbi:MAG: hypothetical protein IKG53_05360 [Solobacterium sp.]|nr:hypothetical protein [Solobacterium sp.]